MATEIDWLLIEDCLLSKELQPGVEQGVPAAADDPDADGT
jgi:hypothetical protein